MSDQDPFIENTTTSTEGPDNHDESEREAADAAASRRSRPVDLVERMDNPLWRAPLRRAKASRGRRARQVILTLLLVICLAVFGYAAYRLVLIGREYLSARKLYSNVASSYTTMAEISPEAGALVDGEDAAADAELPEWYRLLTVDFEQLQAYNPDVSGWLYLEGSDIINYPILYSGDNSAYLRTSIDRKYALAGSIFLDGSNAPDFTDAHSLIYGHQMRDGSMFGTLQRYKEQDDFYAEHLYFQIRTPQKAYRYQVFSYYDVSATDDVYTLFPETGTEEYAQWLAQVAASSYRETGITVTADDRVITLSTCSDDNDRFVVHGVLVSTVDVE